jgi:hypothetical protein
MTSKANESKPSSSKKRKADAGGSGWPTKQSRKISSYFLPLHRASSGPEENESQPVPLNNEQRKVLEMVVEGGKNVFFTGAAGARPTHRHATMSFIWCFWLARHREIATTHGHHICA